MKKIIEVKNLTKKYGDLKAVDDISFSVEKGIIFGFLGPNGAGKTTTLEIIEGLRKPSSGETFVLGINTQKAVDKVKEKIGVQLQQSAYFDYLNLEELLSLFGSFYKKSIKPEELLSKFDLLDKRKSYVKNLSGGQKQRFSFASALVNDPEILFLDEPTTGIDPQSRHYLWNLVKKINKEGKTIILTTHYMEEAQILCDEIAIIDRGKIISHGTPSSIIKTSSIPYKITMSLERNLELLKKMKGILDFKIVKNDNKECKFKIKKIEDLPPIMRQLEANNIKINNLEIRSANLEDVFLELTGKELRE